MAEDLETAQHRARRIAAGQTSERKNADVRQSEAEGSAVGFHLLLGIAALGLLIFALVSLSRPTAPRVSPDVDRVRLAVPPVALTPPIELPPPRGVSDTPPVAAPTPEPATPAVPQNVPSGPVSPASPAASASVTPVPTPPLDSGGRSITAPDRVPAVPSVGDAAAELAAGGGVPPSGTPGLGGTAPPSGPPDTGAAAPDASASPAAGGGRARL